MHTREGLAFTVICFTLVYLQTQIHVDGYILADYGQTLLFTTAGTAWQMINKTDYQLSIMPVLRYYHLNNKLKLNGETLPDTKIEHEENWVDLLVGLQGRVSLTENWYASARVMTAVAGDSDTSYGSSGGVGYIFNKSMSSHVGYRHLKIDYENDVFLYDVKMYGPTIGLVFHW